MRGPSRRATPARDRHQGTELGAAILSPPVQLPGKHGQCDKRARQDHHHQTGETIRQGLHFAQELLTLAVPRSQHLMHRSGWNTHTTVEQGQGRGLAIPFTIGGRRAKNRAFRGEDGRE